MRFLVDQAVSWQVARGLQDLGHDAIHVRDIGLTEANDETILARAVAEQRNVITQDTDFGTLLASAAFSGVSVILLRARDGRPDAHLRLLTQHLPTVEDDLTNGAIVVVTDSSIRIRRLAR